MRLDRTVVIHLDGPDGAGKTTLRERIESLLREFDVETLAFPTEVPDRSFDRPLEEAFYYLSDFRVTFADRVMGREPDFLILDRSFVSTAAYQGFKGSPGEVERVDHKGRDFPEFLVDEGLDLYQTRYFGEKGIVPVFFLLDAPADELADRIEGRPDEVSSLTEMERMARLQDLREAYGEVVEILKGRVGEESVCRVASRGGIEETIPSVFAELLLSMPEAVSR